MEHLLDSGQVEERICFAPDSCLSIVLCLKKDTKHIQAHYNGQRILITLSPTLGKSWGESGMIGLEAKQNVGEGQQLSLLIEKDFPCKGRSGEDASDYFEELQPEHFPGC